MTLLWKCKRKGLIEKAKILNGIYGEGKAIPRFMDVTNKETIQKVVDEFDKIDICKEYATFIERITS